MKTAVIARETQAACGRDLRRKDHERQHYGSGRLASGNGRNEGAGWALRRAGWDYGLQQVVDWSAPRAPPGDPLQGCRRGDERAARMSIPDIFSIRGAAEFRSGEARVILRLFENGPPVLATGGGASMNSDTHAAIAS